MVDKKIPRRDEAIPLLVESFRNDVYSPTLLSKEFWKDFFRMKVEQKATDTSHLEKKPKEIIPEVMRRGSIDIGGGCKIIKCHEYSIPAICAICPMNIDGETIPVCSGPTLEKTTGGLILPESKSYKRNTYNQGCSYSLCRAFTDERFAKDMDDDEFTEFLKYIYRELRDHPEYEVGDVLEENNVDSLDELRDKI